MSESSRFRVWLSGIPTLYPWKTWRIFIILLIINIYIAYQGSNSTQQELENRYWQYHTLASLAANALAMYLILFLGLHHFQHYWDSFPARKRLGQLYHFWHSPDALSLGFNIYYGGKLGAWRDDEKIVSSLATLYSIESLKRCLFLCFGNKLAVDTKPLPEANNITDTDRTRHVIVLGGYLSVPPIKDFSKKAKFICYQNFDDLNQRRVVVAGVDPTSYTTHLENNKIEYDYAILTIAVEKESNRHFYWFSGNYGLATYGAVLLATGNVKNPGIKCPNPGNYSQYIIHVRGITNEEMPDNHSDLVIETTMHKDLPLDFSINLLWNSSNKQPTP